MSKEELQKMSVKKLQTELRTYEDLVNGENACFGRRDIVYLEWIYDEVGRRKLKVKTSFTLTKRDED